jgi:menaquinol-cytochrome c reductase iron-sulfur subunit
MDTQEPISQEAPVPSVTPEETSVIDEATRIRRAGHSRRSFLFKVSLLINGAVGAVMAVPILGYLLGPATQKAAAEESWIHLGSLEDYPEGETRLATFRNPVTTSWDGQTADIPCWVRRVSGSTFQIFAINCAHLGCPVRWFAESKLFLCPCHGGAYYQDGSRASGPPERGLFEYEHRIVNSTLQIFAGKMPTLAATIEKPAPLTQIAGSAQAQRLAGIEMPTARCGSCQD